MWYLDCFSTFQSSDFPMNSYFNESLEVLIEIANRILSRNGSGIDKITIAKTTLGQSPMRAPGFARHEEEFGNVLGS